MCGRKSWVILGNPASCTSIGKLLHRWVLFCGAVHCLHVPVFVQLSLSLIQVLMSVLLIEKLLLGTGYLLSRHLQELLSLEFFSLNITFFPHCSFSLGMQRLTLNKTWGVGLNLHFTQRPSVSCDIQLLIPFGRGCVFTHYLCCAFEFLWYCMSHCMSHCLSSSLHCHDYPVITRAVF